MYSTLSMILTKSKLFQDGELKKTRMSMLTKTLTTPLVPSTTSPKKTNFSWSNKSKTLTKTSDIAKTHRHTTSSRRMNKRKQVLSNTLPLSKTTKSEAWTSSLTKRRTLKRKKITTSVVSRTPCGGVKVCTLASSYLCASIATPTTKTWTSTKSLVLASWNSWRVKMPVMTSIVLRCKW